MKKQRYFLVDFGFATKYFDSKKNEHMKRHELEMFRGNILFASYEQLDF